MTVQELIDVLSEYDPYLQVGITDSYLDSGQRISDVYGDTIDAGTEDEQNVVLIEGGQLL